MEADDSTTQALFDSPYQYHIPVFQRYFSWKRSHWKQLWDDVEIVFSARQTSRENRDASHFMGSLVLVPGPPYPGQVPTLHVIDGQQRIITISLVLSALRNVARSCSLGRLADEIEKTYLLNEFRDGTERYRVLTRQRDRTEFVAAIMARRAPEGRIGEALAFFTTRIRALLHRHKHDKDDAASPKKVLHQLLETIKVGLNFVHINLRDTESPYQAFRSLNTAGMDLSEADLIRNLVFMHLPVEEQDGFDDEHWQPLERHFHDEDERVDGALFTSFFRHFLLMSGDYTPKKDTFSAFEERFGGEDLDPWALTRRLTRYARFYSIVRLQKEPAALLPPKSQAQASTLKAALWKLTIFGSTTAYPLVLNLLDRLDRGAISVQETVACIERVAGFIGRRVICGHHSRGYVRWWPAACRHLDGPGGALEGLTRYLTGKGYPRTERLLTHFVHMDLYGADHTRAILLTLEKAYDHREPADLSETQVEHIMPQHLSAAWRAKLGPGEAEAIHETWLHTPGNLTLSAYNPELRDEVFAVKRDEYARSNVVMTRRLARQRAWGPEEIEARGWQLAREAADIWAGPPSP